MNPLLVGFAATAFVLLLGAAASGASDIRLRSSIYRRLDAPAVDTSSKSWPALGHFHAGDGPKGLPAVLIVALSAISGIAVLVVEGLVPAIVIFGAGLLGGKVASSTLADRARQRYENSVPIAFDAIARSLRSGAGLLVAIEEAGESTTGPIGTDLRRIAREAALGNSISKSLKGWARRHPTPGVQMGVAALTLALETGSAPAHVVDAVAVTLRQGIDARATAQSAATESKASAVVLSGLPLIVSGPMLALNEGARAFMFHHPVGTVILFAGLTLNAIGAFWMSRLIRAAIS